MRGALGASEGSVVLLVAIWTAVIAQNLAALDTGSG
jgi:hypothetical protein